MSDRIKTSLSLGVNLDLDELRLPQEAAVFIKNAIKYTSSNPSASGVGAGSNEEVYHTIEGNKELTISPAAGTNTCIGFYESDTTNEGYFFLHNSNNNHSIWVIRGNTGVVEKVYQGSLLPFIKDPQYYVAQGRATLTLLSYTDPVTNLQTDFKLLSFTTNRGNYQCTISVEDSIATSSYSTSYFTASAAFYNPLELIHYGVPTPLKCIGINTPVAYVPTSEDAEKQNLLVRFGWQIRIKNIDIFRRESEHGIISTQYLSVVGNGCLPASNGLPKCFMVNFDAGNPLVNKFVIEYRRWSTADLSEGWKEYETIDKYNNSTGVPWYSRPYNALFTTSGSGVTFDASTNLISYTFCANKGTTPVPLDETIRTEPGLPINSSGMQSLNKSVALSNNEHAFPAIKQSMVDLVNFSVKLPTEDELPCPPTPTCNITVYLNIYNPYGDYSAIIKQQAGKVVYSGDYEGGGCDTYSTVCTPFNLDQVFGDQDNPGFIGYLANTPYKCVSEQGDFDPSTGIFTPVGFGRGGEPMSFPHQKMHRLQFLNVPCSNYVVRVSSHKCKLNDADIQKYSTNIGGICNIDELLVAYGRRNYAATPIKEIVVDATAGDVHLNGLTDPMFVLLDLGNGVASEAVAGYFYEKEGGDNPIEMAPVLIYGATAGSIGDAFGSFFTDHNGYYFATSGSASVFAIPYVDICNGSGSQPVPSALLERTNRHGINYAEGNETLPGNCVEVIGNWRGRRYMYDSEGTFPECARRRIVQQVYTCDDVANIGVPGVPVVMTKGALGTTASSGSVTLIAHNRYNYVTSVDPLLLPFLSDRVPDYSFGQPDSVDKLIFTQKGECSYNGCTDCEVAVFSPEIDYIDCCTPCDTCRTTSMPVVRVKAAGSNSGGVQSGGRYAIGFVLHDVIGRHTPVQVKQGASGFVDIPNLNDINTPYPTFALSKLQFSIGGGFSVPTYFTKMTICVSSNVAFTDFVSLPADWIQHIDNTGVTNPTNPTSTRIYYGSFNEYRKKYGFQTTMMDIVGKNETSSDFNPDIAQFIMDGDGTFLPAVISSPIYYDQSGLFFTIDYLPELANLKNGCLFRVIRPRTNQDSQTVPYFEQCFTIPVVNGVPTITSGTLPYFDSYLLSRSMPVPIMKGQTTGIPPGGVPSAAIQYTSTNLDATIVLEGYANTNNNNNGVVVYSAVDVPTPYPFYFESPNAADTWGKQLANPGRVMFANPYAGRIRRGTEIAVSAAINDRGAGSFNGISYFESKNMFQFDRNTWGNITVMMVEQGICLVICDSDHFMLSYNASQVVINENGTLSSSTPYGPFSSPIRKAGQNYGCIPLFINTIQKYDGIVTWLDNGGRLVQNNFSASKDIAIESGIYGYVLQKIAAANIANLTPNANGTTFFIGGIDPMAGKYMLTSFNYPVSGSASYINTQSAPNVAVNETLVIDLKTGKLDSMVSFTPEYYGTMPRYYIKKNYLAFRSGTPWLQHANILSGTPPLYANFFGTQCEIRLTTVINASPETVKNFFYTEAYIRQNIAGASGTLPTTMFYADVITTEKNQLSRLLLPQWEIKDGYQCAAFLCDLNTPVDPNLPVQTGAHVIWDGNTLQGRWVKMSLVTNTAYAGTYFEISAIVVGVNKVPISG